MLQERLHRREVLVVNLLEQRYHPLRSPSFKPRGKKKKLEKSGSVAYLDDAAAMFRLVHDDGLKDVGAGGGELLVRVRQQPAQEPVRILLVQVAADVVLKW